MIKNRKDFGSGIFFLAAGLFLAFQSSHLRIWSVIGPVEGFFPLLISGVIVGTSLFIIIKSLVSSKAVSTREVSGKEGQETRRPLRVLWYALLLLFYGGLLEPLGFLITTPVFLVLTLKVVERLNWKKTIWIGAASIAISYFLFSRFLGVPLPHGLLKW